MKTPQMKASFTKKLLSWNQTKNKREMPWKGEKDPYKIWLSEIILQQTRVEQGLDYYNRFIHTYPTVIHLANAPDEQVFKLWEGLGYYSRCKNLIRTARFIASELAGRFPSTYEEILALKGIGPYTAAAIGSFAFNLPYAVVDGNVFRVLARYAGINKDISSTEGKRQFSVLANELLDKKKPGIYNQAIMDFGAVICKPQNPLCSGCPLKKECVAFAKGMVQKLPVKGKKLEKRKRWFYYLLVEYRNKVYVRKRSNKDIWENLYEFVLLEFDGKKTMGNIKISKEFRSLFRGSGAEVRKMSASYSQQLSHQTIEGAFIHLATRRRPALKDYEEIPFTKLSQLAFPRLISRYLTESGYPAFER